ncbi:hypothetical protein PoB_006909600 [Plakobranchus ocellatus]|uniref:Uncharacterized protein n=1 Tax=Plakobranchus ocellatus TaxID=259542 RepID=A0AAV4DEL8_9GAST|nr:hypothetical protein PoB_006909600 [Plakobranchus ocellatus]
MFQQGRALIPPGLGEREFPALKSILASPSLICRQLCLVTPTVEPTVRERRMNQAEASLSGSPFRLFKDQ